MKKEHLSHELRIESLCRETVPFKRQRQTEKTPANFRPMQKILIEQNTRQE